MAVKRNHVLELHEMINSRTVPDTSVREPPNFYAPEIGLLIAIAKIMRQATWQFKGHQKKRMSVALSFLNKHF